MNILENFDLPSMEDNSAEELHLISEAFKMAYADRGRVHGRREIRGRALTAW